MPRDVARAALYRGTINLWVEDELSREYLSALWKSPPDIFFLIAGGNEGVGAVVKDAETAAFPSPLNPGSPVPAIVVTVPSLAIFRTR